MCQHSAGPGLYKRHSVAPGRHGDGCVTRRSIIDSLWPGGPSLSEAGASLLCTVRSGARGEVWLHGLDDSCWHTPLYQTQWNGSLQPAHGHGSQIKPSRRHDRPIQMESPTEVFALTVSSFCSSSELRSIYWEQMCFVSFTQFHLDLHHSWTRASHRVSDLCSSFVPFISNHFCSADLNTWLETSQTSPVCTQVIVAVASLPRRNKRWVLCSHFCTFMINKAVHKVVKAVFIFCCCWKGRINNVFVSQCFLNRKQDCIDLWLVEEQTKLSFKKRSVVGRGLSSAVNTLCFVKPNEMARWLQRTDTGHRSNPLSVPPLSSESVRQHSDPFSALIKGLVTDFHLTIRELRPETGS